MMLPNLEFIGRQDDFVAFIIESPFTSRSFTILLTHQRAHFRFIIWRGIDQLRDILINARGRPLTIDQVYVISTGELPITHLVDCRLEFSFQEERVSSIRVSAVYPVCNHPFPIQDIVGAESLSRRYQ